MLIGLCGAAGSGKDAAASHLVLHHGFTRFAFADALKDIARSIGWNGEKDEIGRKLLQDLGHSSREIIGPNVWVTALQTAVYKAYLNPRKDNIVVTDVRYHNETDWIAEHGGILVKILRPDLDTSGAMYQHPTETNLASFVPDRIVMNTGTLENLWGRMDGVVHTMVRG